jgi:hypothetical protein
MRLFYLIWVDIIIKAKNQPVNKNNWQFMTLAYMTVVMALDLFFIITYLESLLGYYFYDIKIPIIPEKIGDPISFVILFVGPPLLLNYLLIFRNQRYKKLIRKYKYHEGKLGITFLLLALFVPIIALWLGIIFP